MKPMYLILATMLLFTLVAAFVGRSPNLIVAGNLSLAIVPFFLMFKTLHLQRG